MDKELMVRPNAPSQALDIPEVKMPATWPEPSEKAREAMRLATSMFSTKHGLFASVPLVCKGDECPYKDTCVAYMYGVAPKGERCPVEIANITQRFDQYCKELDIDSSKMVNVGLVKELIDCEIMIERCNQLLATEGNLIKDVVVGVSEAGTPFYRPEIHKALDIKNNNMRRKNDILQLLNSTPKDKAKTEDARLIDPSIYAAEILRKFNEAANTIDAEYTEVTDEHSD